MSKVHSSSGTAAGTHLAHFGRVLAQVRALRPNPHSRGEVELVVGGTFALLHVYRGGLAGEVVHPAQALCEDGAVRLDRSTVALLQAVACVVAAQEGFLDLLVRVEDQRRHPLETRRGVQLFPQPEGGWAASGQIDSLDGSVGVPARRCRVRSRELPMNNRDHSSRDLQPQRGVVVREARARAIPVDVPVSCHQPEQLGDLRRRDSPTSVRSGISCASASVIAGLDLARRHLDEIGVEHVVVRGDVDHARASLNREELVIGIARAPARRGDRGHPCPALAVPDLESRLGDEVLHRCTASAGGERDPPVS